MLIEGHLLACESDFETPGGCFGVTLGSCVGLMGPESGNVEKVLVFTRFLIAQMRGECECCVPGGGFWEHFEVTLGRFL